MPTVYMWGGATTTESFWVRATIAGQRARLVVARDPGFGSVRRFGPATASPDGVVSIRARGLTPDTRYHYALEIDGVDDRELVGRIRTLPSEAGPVDVTIGAFSCAGLDPH